MALITKIAFNGDFIKLMSRYVKRMKLINIELKLVHPLPGKSGGAGTN